MLTWAAIRALPWKWIGLAVLVLGLVLAVVLHFRTDTRTRATLAALTEQAGNVVLATRNASGNDDVTWKTTPGQIVALGESVRSLKSAVQTQNRAIDQLAAEAVAAKAKAAELKVIADKAQAQRASALRRLSDLSLTPGTRDDCMVLLAEAEQALDITYQALR